MKYLVDKPQRRRFTQDRISFYGKHVKVLRELPQDIETRTTNVHKRAEILRANKRYELEIERRRAHSALQTIPQNQQANLRRYLSQVNADLLELARKGYSLPQINED